MSDKLQVIQNKRIRGHILALLEQAHPTPTPKDSIATALVESGMTDNLDIDGYVDYLEDRAYITVLDATTALKRPIQFLKLTSKGIDLLEETATDPGVDL